MHGSVRWKQRKLEQVSGYYLPLQGRGKGERGRGPPRAASLVRGGSGRVVEDRRRKCDEMVGCNGHAPGLVRPQENRLRDIRRRVLLEAGGERADGRVYQTETRPSRRACQPASGRRADRHDLLDAEETDTQEDTKERDNQLGRHDRESALHGQHGEEEDLGYPPLGRGDDGQVFRQIVDQMPPPQTQEGEVLARAERGEVSQV